MFRTQTAVLLLMSAMALPALAQDTARLTAAVSDTYGNHIATEDGTPVYIMETEVQAGDFLIPLESCKQNCLDDWPYLLTDGTPTVGEGLDDGLASYVEWEGQRIATYDGRVLFTFAFDDRTEEPDGQGIHAHGGRWYLLLPEGGLNTTGAVPPESATES